MLATRLIMLAVTAPMILSYQVVSKPLRGKHGDFITCCSLHRKHKHTEASYLVRSLDFPYGSKVIPMPSILGRKLRAF